MKALVKPRVYHLLRFDLRVVALFVRKQSLVSLPLVPAMVPGTRYDLTRGSLILLEGLCAQDNVEGSRDHDQFASRCNLL